MTSILKPVISIDSKGNEKTYDSISLAAKFMVTLEKFKDCNESSIISNISGICKGSGTRKLCCGLSWKYKTIETFEFIESDWRKFRQTHYYFSKHHEFYYNINKKTQVYGDKTGIMKVHLQDDTGYSILFRELKATL